jgi:hypothetical protein
LAALVATTEAEGLRRLKMFLEDLPSRRWRPGEWDCLLMVAAWVIALDLPDPAAEFRGRYRSERGAARFLRREGGCVALMAPRLEALGFRRVEPAERRPGDVGAVRVLAEATMAPEVAGAVRVSARSWAVVTGRGVLLAPADTVACWRPPWRLP